MGLRWRFHIHRTACSPQVAEVVAERAHTTEGRGPRQDCLQLWWKSLGFVAVSNGDEFTPMPDAREKALLRLRAAAQHSCNSGLVGPVFSLGCVVVERNLEKDDATVHDDGCQRVRIIPSAAVSWPVAWQLPSP